jgi:hypothetical protein
MRVLQYQVMVHARLLRGPVLIPGAKAVDPKRDVLGLKHGREMSYMSYTADLRAWVRSLAAVHVARQLET